MVLYVSIHMNGKVEYIMLGTFLSFVIRHLWTCQQKNTKTPFYQWKLSIMMAKLCFYSLIFQPICVLCSCNYLLPLRINKVHRTCKALVYGKWLTALCQQLHCCILGSNNANDIVINSVDASTSCLLSAQMNCCSQFTGCSQVSRLLSSQVATVNIAQSKMKRWRFLTVKGIKT